MESGLQIAPLFRIFLPALSIFLPKIDFGQWAQAVVFVGEDGLNWLEMEFQSRILTLATYVN